MKYTIDILVGDKHINDFMHLGDVFEAGKQLCIAKELLLEINISKANLSDLFAGIKKVLEDNNSNVIFIGSLSLPIEPYFMQNVQSISNGTKWGLFKDYLESKGYNVQTDETMHVNSITN